MGLIIDTNMFPILWNFIWVVIAISSPKAQFLYSVQLFSLFNLVPTMRTVLYAVRLRYLQFLATGLTILIIVYFFSAVGFFWLNSQFTVGNLGNVCDSFISCFLYNLQYGLRTDGGGIGDTLGQLKYGDPFYWGRFVYDWLFFIIMILIMLNSINGIIVDTFQDLREKNNEKEYKVHNICYVCDLDRNEFEMNGVNFDDHRTIHHSLWNYIHYIIKIKLTSPYELSSLESQVLYCLNQDKIDFLPIKKSYDLDKIQKKNAN